MRAAALLLLVVAPWAAADHASILLREQRAWKGFIQVRALTKSSETEYGSEEQTERIEIVLVSEPQRRTGAVSRLPLREISVTGSYGLKIDLKEPADGVEGLVSRRGSGEGRLHMKAQGWVDPVKGVYRISAATTPKKITALTSSSGLVNGRLQTFRSVRTRATILARFVASGRLEDKERTIRGTRTYEEGSGQSKRGVSISWELRRVDPVLLGRVVGGDGRPVPGVKVLARTNTPERASKRLPQLVREAVTDRAGRFRIEAFWGTWAIQALGNKVSVHGETRLVAGMQLEKPTVLRFDDAPEIELELDIYRVAALPRIHTLRRSFNDDVDAYLRYWRQRAPRILDRARVR
jgi:hypothetical protein